RRSRHTRLVSDWSSDVCSSDLVTDPKKANLALRWAVDEMERRYELVSKAGVRDILAYNKKVEKQLADGPPKIEAKKIKIYVEGEIGRASCREREEMWVGGEALN